MARQYTLRRRAEQMEDTRRRILEATVWLHRTVGPARTTISGVAELACVQRLTVYRHFADDTALLTAAVAHWRAQTPPPVPGRWAAIDDPLARLDAALADLATYYAAAAPVWGPLARDAASVPALAPAMKAWDAWLDEARDVLLHGWPGRGRTRDRARLAVGLALDFATWATLTRLGAGPATARDLLVAAVRAQLSHPAA